MDSAISTLEWIKIMYNLAAGFQVKFILFVFKVMICGLFAGDTD